MAENYELEFLKTKEQGAFKNKQYAWERYTRAKKAASAAHEKMDSAWAERCAAREEMNREFQLMQKSSDLNRAIWDEYGRIRDRNNSRIDELRRESDREHQEMLDCFEQASSEYENGDRAIAPIRSQEGHEHKERRNEMNAEIGKLIQEIRDAKANAERTAPKTDSSAFRDAKAVFEEVRARHESAQAEFKRLKSERDRLKREFERAQEEHNRLKEEYRRMVDEIKTQRRESIRQATTTGESA